MANNGKRRYIDSKGHAQYLDPTDDRVLLADALELVHELEYKIGTELGYHPDMHPLYFPHAHESKHAISRLKEALHRMLAEADKLAA